MKLFCAFSFFLSVAFCQSNFIMNIEKDETFKMLKQIHIDEEENVFVTFISQGKVDFLNKNDFQPENSDYFLYAIKMDKSLKLKKIFSIKLGQGNYKIYFNSAIDSKGNLIITGRFSEKLNIENDTQTVYQSNGNHDIFVIKLNNDLKEIWVKTIGGASEDWCNFAAVDKNDNIYLTGSFSGSVNFDSKITDSKLISKGTDDIFILKLTSNGSFSWVKHFGYNHLSKNPITQMESGWNISLNGNSLVVFGTINKNYFKSSEVNDYDEMIRFLTCYDLDGNQKWINNIDFNIGVAQIIPNKDNFLIAGRFSKEVTFDFNNTENYLTAKGLNDIYIAEYTVNGKLSWVKQIISESSNMIKAPEFAYGISASYNGDLFLSAEYLDNIKPDFQNNKVQYFKKGVFQKYFLSYSKNFALSWFLPYNGIGFDGGLVKYQNNNIYFACFVGPGIFPTSAISKKLKDVSIPQNSLLIQKIAL